MPFYEYECPKCLTTRSELLTYDEFKSSSIECCKTPMNKIISAPKGYVKGSDTPVKQK